MTERSNSKDKYPRKIKRLIEMVEHNIKFKKFKRTVLLKRLPRAIAGLSLVIVFAFAFFCIFQMGWLYLKIVETEGNIESFVTITISMVALTIAGGSFIINLTRDISPLHVGEFSKEEKEYVTNRYFKSLKEEYMRKEYEKEDLPLLKALISMKCKQPNIDLKIIYKKDASIFEEKRLLKSLYEFQP